MSRTKPTGSPLVLLSAACAFGYAGLSAEAQVRAQDTARAGDSVQPASSASASRGDDTFMLGTIEVVGRRAPAVVAATTFTVDTETLAAKHRDDLSTALDLVPGVSLQNVGQRRERLVTVRGFSSRQVPLFIDGVPVYVPYDGNVDLARFGVDYVSRIDVSKGLASLLYGPNTLGGAVNVVSRKPTQPFEASGRLASEMDSHGDGIERRVAGSLGGTAGRWYGYLTASAAHSDGYRLPSDFVPVAAEDGGMREAARSRDTVISAKIGFEPNEDHEYALTFYKQKGDKQDPPYAGSYLSSPTRPDGVRVRYWTWPYWDKQSLYFVARDRVGANGTLRWRLFHDTFKNSLESYDDDTYTTQTRPYAFHGSNYDDYTYGGSLDFAWDWSDSNTTRIAMHYRQDVHREEQIAPFSPRERLEIPTYDVALEHEWRVSENVTLTPSYSHMIEPARTMQVYDGDTDTFTPIETDRSSADNAQVVATYRVADGGSFFAGISRKTRFPTIKERFSGGLGSVVPNPGLDPESAAHYEVGYEQRGGNWGAKVALFRSNLHDAIESVTIDPTACTVQPCSQLRNIGRQRNRGVELSFDYAPLERLQLDAQINVVDIDNLSNPDIRPTAPEYKYLLSGDWQFARDWRLRIDAQHESKRYSNSTGTRVADSFTLTNLFVRYTPMERLGLELGVRNAGDELYAYEEGYYEAGRTWLAQADFRF
jgi:iron complex outermembrane receptor protein